MAWLPQISEFERDEWRGKASRRISFLERFSEMSRPDSSSQTIRLTSANALTQAAELAFATDQTRLGRKLMKRALDSLLQGPVDAWPIVRTALLGSLLSEVGTSLTPTGVVLKDAGRMRSPSWNGPVSLWERAAGPLIASAVAYGSLENALLLLLNPAIDVVDSANRLAFLIFANAREVDTLPAFGFERREDGGLIRSSDGYFPDFRSAAAAFISLHQRYAARLRLLAVDSAHWRKELRPRVPLIDWTLLALDVALVRRGGDLVRHELTLFPYDEPSKRVIRFMLSLADELR
jgi:hypothetical protein